MKVLLAAAAAGVLAASVASAEPVWRWSDSSGGLHYSNQRALVPASAAVVRGSLAAGDPMEPNAFGENEPATDSALAGRAPSEARPVTRRLHRIYDQERLRFGCYSAGVLFFGGWAHADDLSSSVGCYRYLLGPEAWLNTARAELAVRENGISPRELYQMYRGQGVE